MTVRAKVSVTIGANLDDQLRPVAATLLSVNDRRFTSSTFLDRLLGKHGEGFRGLSPLHTVLDLPEGGGLSGSQSSQRNVNPFIKGFSTDLRILKTLVEGQIEPAAFL
jgi:hypothetical protein